MKFETDRLIIRRFCEEDWKDLNEYLSDEKVVKYEPYGVFNEEESKQEAIKRSKQDSFWAVCLKENKKLIGNVYFTHNGPEELSTYEIGYVFNSKFWGNGYATEACQVFIAYAFEELRAHRVMAGCDPTNEASWKLLERLNMRREAHFLKNIFFKKDKKGNPIWTDSYMYAILESEFDKR